MATIKQFKMYDWSQDCWAAANDTHRAFCLTIWLGKQKKQSYIDLFSKLDSIETESEAKHSFYNAKQLQ